MSKLTTEQKLAFSGVLKSIRGSRNDMWNAIDQAVKIAVPAIASGDNISLINRIVDTMKGSKDQADIVRVVRKFVPFKVEDGKFTTKQKGKVEKCEEAYRAFLVSGRTIRTEIAQDAKASKPVLTPEQQTERDIVAAQKAFAKLIADGLSPEEVIALLMATVQEESKAA
jgi:hypothetical protein